MNPSASRGAAASLPPPTDAARAHSERLRALLREDIARAGGVIPFSRFMELCLYAPGLGYYSAGATKFGAAGDFVTAPELGDLFARCVARAIAPVLRGLGTDARVLELGGGSGAFAEDALRELSALDALPSRYDILEPSAELAQRQRERFAALDEAWAARVSWAGGPIAQPWTGVLFANEVIDALPTTRFSMRGGEVYEEAVSVADDGGFRRVDIPADALVRSAVRRVEQGLGRELPDGYRSEVLPQLPYWLQAVAGGMQRGMMLFVDYGYPRREFYLDERGDGTLVCHYRHRAHGDPFQLPGLQDVTAFVDFSALAEGGAAAGFELAGYGSQAAFLMSNGIDAILAADETADDVRRLARVNEMKRLTLPGEMGERFQVMALSRGIDAPELFRFGDQRHRL